MCVWVINVKEYDDALKAQIDKLIHVSNLYYTRAYGIEAAHKLVNACRPEQGILYQQWYRSH